MDRFIILTTGKNTVKKVLLGCTIAFYSLASFGSSSPKTAISPEKSGSLSSLTDSIAGTLSTAIIGGSSLYPSLFTHAPEKILFYLSQARAKKIFWHAYNTVPAYKNFVDKNSPLGLPKTFQEIPVTNKTNYIKSYEPIQTLVQGKMPLKGQIDTSTGTSGKPTKWIRGSQEMQNVKCWIDVASKAALGKKPYIFCNMFALGPWATGMTSSYALSGSQIVVSIGPNRDMLYEILKELGPNNKYVIAGYPPHMKKLVDNAPFDLKTFDIIMVTGGEAMSDTVRESLIDKGITAVFSSYGASDLRINIAQQTEFEQELQALCKRNHAFKEELLGSLDKIPLFFHYNPLLDYIEEAEDETLLFTDLDQSRVSPRVRYDLGDKGKILKISEVTALLKKYGYTLKPRTHLPLLCLYGRGEDTLIFNGANLIADELEVALQKVATLSEKINRYAYNKFENKQLDQQLEFWIELKDGYSLSDIQEAETINAQLIETLCTLNQDFKFQIDIVRKDNGRLPMPRTLIFEYGKSPMLEQGPHHKNKYVYNIKNDQNSYKTL